MTVEQRRPRARTWLLAAVELAAAILVARLIGWIAQNPASAPVGDHGMSGMPGMAAAPAAHWGWMEYTAIGVAAAALAWWLLLRQPVAAVPAAAGAAVLAASPAVRALATRSHLIAMVELELVLVIVPLLVLAAANPRGERLSALRSRNWTMFTVVAALLYSALLIVIHLPAVHSRSAKLDSVPLWVVALALAIGMAYWPAVLRTVGRVPTQIRRAALFGAQEVAAFIGLLSLFGAWGAMAHSSPLGISMVWDQRLGGVVMMATCAAVTIPIASRI
jgi:Cytochrome c oxidase caa3 assembly factor (Caa3_CtaG)